MGISQEQERRRCLMEEYTKGSAMQSPCLSPIFHLPGSCGYLWILNVLPIYLSLGLCTGWDSCLWSAPTISCPLSLANWQWFSQLRQEDFHLSGRPSDTPIPPTVQLAAPSTYVYLESYMQWAGLYICVRAGTVGMSVSLTPLWATKCQDTHSITTYAFIL